MSSNADLSEDPGVNRGEPDLGIRQSALATRDGGGSAGPPRDSLAGRDTDVGEIDFDLLNDLTVSVLADALDRLDYRHQIVGHPIRSIVSPARIFGRAFTIQAIASAELREPPYEHALAATDAIPEGAVVVFSAGGVMDAGVWGELLTTRARTRGAIGVVVDGAVRDLEGIERLRFPTFAAAVHAADSHGRAEVVSFNEPIICGGVSVTPGDLIGADRDGVIVIPTVVAAECIRDAWTKRSKERAAQEMLRRGATVKDTYERHGVL